MTFTTIGHVTKTLLNSLKVTEEIAAPHATGQIYCESCKSLSECQYNESGRGFMLTQETHQFGTTYQTYDIWRKCHHKLQAEQQDQINRLFEQSGLPLSKRHLSLSNIECPMSAKVAAGNLILNKINQLYLIGERAKELAIAIGNALTSRTTKVKYMTAAELSTSLRYQDNAAYMSNLEHVLEVNVLIVEGISSERWTAYSEEQISMVIERRARKGKRTVISSRTEIESKYKVLSEQAREMQRTRA